MRKVFLGSMVAGLCVAMASTAMADNRVSASKKGSLLMYSKVELKWACNTAGCRLIQDTFLDISNDYPADVYVQLYFVNGDEPLEAVYAGDPPVLMEREHPGWNWVDCQIKLTANQPTYWSAFSGQPAGCQPFTILDPGYPEGRPDPDGVPGIRVLRGFVYAWAVNNTGAEINWNHLTGDALLINYAFGTAWEYNAYAAQAIEGSNGSALGDPGVLNLDGVEYDQAYDKLLLDFYAVADPRTAPPPFNGDNCVVLNDTDLTIYPISQDLRQDNDGPIYTKVHADIWNQNEIRMSGTERCITCWDQILLSQYDNPNTYLRQNLQTNKGKARFDGQGSTQCPFSTEEAILGVAAKELIFSCTDGTRFAKAGRTLVGQGEQSAIIQWDIISPPGTLEAPFVVGDKASGRIGR